MEAIKPPKTVKFYQLMKMSTKNSFTINSCGTTSSTNYIGTGIYLTLKEAECNRTLETLKDTDSVYNSYHIFELEFPNPIYKE
jgi:hypothetical protein